MFIRFIVITRIQLKDEYRKETVVRKDMAHFEILYNIYIYTDNEVRKWQDTLEFFGWLPQRECRITYDFHLFEISFLTKYNIELYGSGVV